MKICVLELDGAAPEIIFADERLVNLRRLMDVGLYGTLQSEVPASASFKSSAIWDQMAREGKKSILIGIPPTFAPRAINGIRVGSSLTPDPANEFTYPASIRAEIEQLVGEYPFGTKDLSASHTNSDETLAKSGKQWQVVRHLMTNHEWDYFHFVDVGLDRLHQAFSNHIDKNDAPYEPGNSFENVVPNYYLWLDEQIGGVMELIDSETILLVVSANSRVTSQEQTQARPGTFLLAAPNCPLSGEFSGAHLCDIGPTLLDLAGCEIPESMQGRSLVAGMEKKSPDQGFGDAESEQLIQDRLAGLGYI
jgi:predicted AlkP superfamily phosphohydrolase/phosphomutase